MKDNILLVGPKLFQVGAAYGGGTGGYTRNMSTYLDTFSSSYFNLMPSFHTVRTEKNNFVVRMFQDFFIVLLNIIKCRPVGAHILAQYRTAIYREFMVVLVFRLFRIPYIYDVKAGAFIQWYTSSGKLKRFFCDYIIRHAARVFAEGEVYIPFILKEFSVSAIYWPNFVSTIEVPDFITRANSKESRFKILFVGYCYEGKGIYKLIEACNWLAARGMSLELNIIGEESPEYKVWLSGFEANSNLKLHRHGRLENSEVLDAYLNNDVFCLPSEHSGEGHNNSINEAMMSGISIVCTKHGFLEHVLHPDCALFLDEDLSLVDALNRVLSESSLRKNLSKNARRKFMENFHSDIVIPRLNKQYIDVFK